jgi:GT2 family glycosyltransferase
MIGPDTAARPDRSDGTPGVTVIVVNYNAGPWLARCLDALLAQSTGGFDVIVVDNASTDDSLALSAGALADLRVRLERLGANTGFAAANNQAAALTQATWIALLNPDAFPDPDWLERLLDATRRYPDVAMFGSTQIDAADHSRLDGAGDQYLFAGLPWRGGYGAPVAETPPEGEVFSPCAAAALYRRDAFAAAGGFDERYFCYIEDVDLAFRLRLAGERCIQVPDARVQHVGGGSGGTARAGVSDFARFHGTRNLVWTFVKCMPGGLFWLLLPVHAAFLMALCLRASLRGRSGPVWRGVGAALAGLSAAFASRRKIQRARTATARDIAQALCWSLPRYLRRDAFTRPMR